MIGKFNLALCSFSAIAVASCSDMPCDEQSVIDLITKQIVSDGRSPSEFFKAMYKQEGGYAYVEMAAKLAPLYRRRYVVELERCRIHDLKIDQ